MALQLFRSPANIPHSNQLHLLAAYEDGRVVLFRFAGSEAAAVRSPTGRREAGEGWVLEWEEKGHREAGELRLQTMWNFWSRVKSS